MSDASSQYYVAIKCSGGEKESRFARLKDFLLSAISRLVWRLRKWFSRVIFNGRPVARKIDEELPPGFRRMSHKKLKKLKKALGEFIAETQAAPEVRAGNVPPPPTRCVSYEDLEIEIFRINPVPSVDATSEAAAEDEKPGTPEVPAEDSQDAAAAPEEEAAGEPEPAAAAAAVVEVEEPPVVRRKLPRPKAAKGRRGETVIPDYIIIDDEEVRTMDTTHRRNRPKAAKGTRTVCEHPIDLPAEVLLDRYDPERRQRATVRQRPVSPKPRPPVEEVTEDDLEADPGADLDAQVDELLTELRSITVVKPEKRLDSYIKRQKSYTLSEQSYTHRQDSHAHRQEIHSHMEESQAPATVAVGGAKPANSSKKAAKKRAAKRGEEDIFNVPYLPPSQINHESSGLSLPWLN